MKILIDRGANIDAFTNGIQTPLYLAAVHKNTEIMKLLIEKGANEDYYGTAFLDYFSNVIAEGKFEQ